MAGRFNNTNIILQKDSRTKSPYLSESLPSPETCSIVDSSLRHTPWYDDVNIHKVQIEKGNYKTSVKKKRYKNTVRSAKSVIKAPTPKQSPTKKAAPNLPIKKKVVPKSTYSPINAAKRKNQTNIVHKASPYKRSIKPQMKGNKSTPSNRSIHSNDTKTSGTTTQVHKIPNDSLQFTSDSEQGKDQPTSAPVNKTPKEELPENRPGKPPGKLLIICKC